MQITKEFLIKKKACLRGLTWFKNQSETDLYRLIDNLIQEDQQDWANWLIARTMSRPQQLQYAINCAELVLPIFEARFPDDKRPRLAIQTVKKVLEEDSQENRQAAAIAARAAAYAADAGYVDGYTVGDAGYAAAYAAANAAHVVDAAADAAAEAAADAGLNWKQILELGINILKGENK